MAKYGRISYPFSWFTQPRSCFRASLAASLPPLPPFFGSLDLFGHFNLFGAFGAWCRALDSNEAFVLLLDCCVHLSFQQSAANSLVHIRVYVKHSMNAGEILRAWYCPFRTPCQTVQHNGTVDILRIKQLLESSGILSMQSPQPTHPQYSILPCVYRRLARSARLHPAKDSIAAVCHGALRNC